MVGRLYLTDQQVLISAHPSERYVAYRSPILQDLNAEDLEVIRLHLKRQHASAPTASAPPSKPHSNTAPDR